MTAGGLGKRILRVLLGQEYSERRRAERSALPGLVAHYWDGGNPAPRKVRDISSSGIYLLTEQRWYLGTLMMITLQNNDSANDDPYRSITVRAKVAQVGADGVGLAFVAADGPKPTDGAGGAESNAADKRTIDEFIHRWFQTSRNKM